MTVVNIVDYINCLRSFYLNIFDGYLQIIFYVLYHSHITALGISVTSISRVAMKIGHTYKWLLEYQKPSKNGSRDVEEVLPS